MLYILGGSPRCGKSILSHQFVKKGIPYFCIDCLISVLELGIPNVGIKHGQPFTNKAESLWPIVKPLLLHVYDNDPTYLIEGDGILPKHAAEFKIDHPDCKIAFVGFTTIDPEKKLKHIRLYKSVKNDWTGDRSDESMLSVIKSMIDYSRYIEEECKKYNITYFDCSNDFESYLQNVARYFFEN